ncbi:MAG: M20 family metallopeptidase [Candidatus Bathyarchaeia archaeon]
MTLPSEKYIVETAEHLIRLQSVNPPGREAETADYVGQLMSQIGMEVQVCRLEPDRANVIGRIEGTGGGPKLMLNGHLDVVPPGELDQWRHPPFEPHVEGGQLFGRGSCDMKGGVSAILAAVKSIVDSKTKLKGDLLVTFVADEESLGKGVNDLVERGYSADMAVIGEPTRLQVVTAHKGLIWVELTTFGKSAHASTVKSNNRGDEVNAIYKMCKAISTTENYLPVLEKRRHKLVGNPTISVGEISGGTKPNVVPDNCRAMIERRMLPGERSDQVIQEIRKLFDSIGMSDRNFKYDLRIVNIRDATEISEHEKIVKFCRDSVKEVTGVDPGITGFIATSDMATLVNRAKIPTVLLGPGDLAQAHAPNEFVSINELILAARIYEHLIMTVLR